MSLIRVWTDVGTGKNVSLVARIVDTNGVIFSIRYLSPTEDKDKHGCTIYRYEDEIYQIDDDSITHYLDTDDETDIGFKEVDTGGWIRVDEESDDDYVPSDEDEGDEDETEEEDVEVDDECDDDFGEDDCEDDFGDDDI